MPLLNIVWGPFPPFYRNRLKWVKLRLRQFFRSPSSNPSSKLGLAKFLAALSSIFAQNPSVKCEEQVIQPLRHHHRISRQISLTDEEFLRKFSTKIDQNALTLVRVVISSILSKSFYLVETTVRRVSRTPSWNPSLKCANPFLATQAPFLNKIWASENHWSFGLANITIVFPVEFYRRIGHFCD